MDNPATVALRCERCRAVFSGVFDGGAPPAAVQCGRCGYVFPPKPPAEIDVGGEPGGAAANVKDDTRRPASTSQRWQVPRGLVVVALLLLVGLAVVLMRTQRPVISETPASASERMAAGETLLWLDDHESLTAAMAAFADAESLEPARVEARALRGTASILLGLCLRARAELESPDAASTDEARRRAEQLTRAQQLIQEGTTLAQEASRSASALSWRVQRAKMLADAMGGTATRSTYQTAPQTSSREPSPLAWEAFTAGLAKARTVDAAVLSDWEVALQRSPSFIRVRWLLAAGYLVGGKPAARSLTELLDGDAGANPRHEMVLLLRERLSLVSQP